VKLTAHLHLVPKSRKVELNSPRNEAEVLTIKLQRSEVLLRRMFHDVLSC
jgi:hypothetical protein